MAAPHQDQHRRWSANFWHGSSEVLTMSDAAREIIVLTKNDGEPIWITRISTTASPKLTMTQFP
jgi:hypothetical protein